MNRMRISMKKPAKKWTALICALLYIIPLVSCGPNREAALEDVTIITVAKPKNMLGIDELVDDFEQLNPNIQVKLIDMPESSDDRHGTCVSALSGGDSSVDLYLIDDCWVDEFAKYDYILPLAQYLQVDQSAFLPEAVSMFSSGHQLYAMPVMMDMNFLYYRKDLINEIPGSWDDVFRIIKAVKPSAGIPYGIDLPNEIGQDMVYSLRELELANNNDISLALNTYKNLLDSNYSQKGMQNQFFYTFKSGKALFLTDSSLAWSKLNDDVSSVKSNVGITVLPRSADKQDTSLLSGYGLAVNKRSRHITQSVQLLEYFGLVDTQRAMAQQYSYMPVIQSLYEDEMVLDFNPHFKGLLEIIPHLSTCRETEGYPRNSRQAQSVLNAYFNGKIPLEEAAANLNAINDAT